MMIQNTSDKNDIRNFSYEELVEYLNSHDEKAFRAKQIFEWIYKKNVWSFKDMKTLSASLRKRLEDDFELKRHKIEKKEISIDGTTKFLFELNDKEKIETVLIPTATRSTICVSIQAGCKFGCKFCASGIGGLKRNLTQGEILTQMQHIKEEAKKHKKPLSHVVFMGVGEPMDNYDNLIRSIKVINDSKGMGIGIRRITISTCGVIPKIQKLAMEDMQVELAISLHGYDNESRNVLMPVNRKYPFDDLMETCRDYVKKTNRQITFEYILIKDITCSEKAIRALREAFKGMICKMNLIPYNPIAEFDHKTPSRQEMYSFRDRLIDFGIHAIIRAPRGRDVSAACGQLRHST